MQRRFQAERRVASRRWHGGLFFGRWIERRVGREGDKWVSRYMRFREGVLGFLGTGAAVRDAKGERESVIGRPKQRTKGGRVPGRACQLDASLKGNTRDTWNKESTVYVSRFIRACYWPFDRAS